VCFMWVSRKEVDSLKLKLKPGIARLNRARWTMLRDTMITMVDT
jgi:hypothetical protein